MTLKTEVIFSKNKTNIRSIDHSLEIQIKQTKSVQKKLSDKAIYLVFNERKLQFIGTVQKIISLDKPIFTQLVELNFDVDTDLIYMERLLVNHALEAGLLLANSEEINVPENITNQLNELKTNTLLILDSMGYSFEKEETKKCKPGKARHKWTKEVSEKEFYIDTRGSKACVMWIKRNQMLIKKGATMMKEAPLNKDGSVGFSAKMGDKIRTDHKDQFENFTTTEDIILKSVNEVGLFLYFAGTNSWLEMIDDEGKTLNAWTVAE